MPFFGLYGGLIAFNLLVWGWAFAVFHRNPTLLGIAGLAYSLGLRHAVDADHIAAIDNVTRKLMQAGQRPLSVGLYFSLGHSTVVVLVSTILALTAKAMTGTVFRDIGSLIGTVASSAFLFAIALANVLILRSLLGTLRRIKARGVATAQDTEHQLTTQGPMVRLLRPLLRLITRSWQMYLLGLLFGLGFDTATEIGVLGISATEAAKGLSFAAVLVFPLLFTAAMSLIDTLDSTVMVGVYGWAFVNPLRKLYYNITITGASVVIALVVGTVEALGLFGNRLNLSGSLFNLVSSFNAHFALWGYLIIGGLVLSWLLSVTVYRLRRYATLERDT